MLELDAAIKDLHICIHPFHSHWQQVMSDEIIDMYYDIIIYYWKLLIIVLVLYYICI